MSKHNQMIIECLEESLSKATHPEYVDAIKREIRRHQDLINSHRIEIVWVLDDVRKEADNQDLTDEFCAEILGYIDDSYDANEGITWTHIYDRLAHYDSLGA